MKPKPLRVGFPFRPGSYTDPGRIVYAPQYILFENIFSPLIELSKTGEITAGVAERFEWRGDEAYLTIRDTLKTIEGKPITATDAANSLKRLIILTGNSHGDLKSILCPSQQLHRLSDPCSGIEVRGNTLILKPGTKRTFLLPMLTAIDFAVIPTSSINDKTLEITNLKNTSGPYYIDEYKNGKPYILRANPFHYHYSKTIPQEIRLESVDIANPEDSLQKFAAGKIDLITTVDLATPDELILFAHANPDSTIHQTQPIKVYLAYFSASGLKKFDVKSRHYLALRFKALLRKPFIGKPGFEKTDQFFPAFGTGGLVGNDSISLQNFLASTESFEDSLSTKTLTVGVWIRTMVEPIRKVLQSGLGDRIKVNVHYYTQSPLSSSDHIDVPDVEIGSTDTGYTEDVSLLSYNISMDQFGLGTAGRQWLAHYVSIQNKNERIQLLQKLHLDILTRPVVVPYLASPYVAVARRPWKMDLPDLYANNPFWRIYWSP